MLSPAPVLAVIRHNCACIGVVRRLVSTANERSQTSFSREQAVQGTRGTESPKFHFVILDGVGSSVVRERQYCQPLAFGFVSPSLRSFKHTRPLCRPCHS